MDRVVRLRKEEKIEVCYNIIWGGEEEGGLMSQSLPFDLGPSVYGVSKFSLQIMTNQIRHGDPSTSWLVHMIDRCSCKI